MKLIIIAISKDFSCSISSLNRGLFKILCRLSHCVILNLERDSGVDQASTSSQIYTHPWHRFASSSHLKKIPIFRRSRNIQKTQKIHNLYFVFSEDHPQRTYPGSNVRTRRAENGGAARPSGARGDIWRRSSGRSRIQVTVATFKSAACPVVRHFDGP